MLTESFESSGGEFFSLSLFLRDSFSSRDVTAMLFSPQEALLSVGLQRLTMLPPLKRGRQCPMAVVSLPVYFCDDN